MLHSLSSAALRWLPAEDFKNLRNRYRSIRYRMAPLIRSIYGTFDTSDLRSHLEERVGHDFEILMVHSSLNHLQPSYQGNALELVRMLIDYCGSTRTLAMPAYFFGDPKIGDVIETFRRQPRFDLQRTASQMGVATEIFRRTKGVLQSRHPTSRTCAYGPLAKEITTGHERAMAPSGYGTPFDVMAKHNTVILGIGTSYHVITQIHYVNDILGDKLPVSRRPESDRATMNITIVDGSIQIPMILRGGGIQGRLNMKKLPSLLQDGDLQSWTFHHAPFFTIRADVVTSRLVEAAERGESVYDPLR
jgi:aminoglycoside N3'-acetyltransferase